MKILTIPNILLLYYSVSAILPLNGIPSFFFESSTDALRIRWIPLFRLRTSFCICSNTLLGWK